MRLRALPFCFATSLAVLFAVAAAWSQEQPNIIVILADDLGYSDLGCYGGEINTPHIDALAAGGPRLAQVYNSPRCVPSRASLMTGLYPTQAGIGDFTTRKPNPSRGPGYLGRLRDDCVTMAEVLKPAGYGCYYVGKWHLHNETGPIRRGFDEFYGYTFDHSHDQYDADYYVRLPEGRAKEIDPAGDEFYATDVFNEYAVEFIKQGQQTDKPWFLFLGHSSPHFPVQAPPERADKYDETYRRGWDVLRTERFARMQELGLVDGEPWKLSPREIVPVDRDDIANGFSGQQNPAWDSLDEDRQQDLARRMAVFAAMVEGVDQGVGKIVDHLKETGDLENTLIVFLSDNGACYEWGPFGFDGVSRRGETILRTGEDLRNIGGRGTHQSYGSGWANLGNTPFRLYKHFTHEGGISTPCIVHWPQGIGRRADWVRDPAHVMDVLPTLMEAAAAEYPARRGDQPIQPLEGRSLLPVLRGESPAPRTIGFDHQAAHALRDGDWKAVYSKRMPATLRWELYNLAEDRCELNDLADQHPQRLAAMVEDWEQWAKRVGVTWAPYATALPVAPPAATDVDGPPSAATEGPVHQPNIVLVFIDDMGWGDFSCFGNDDANTPHIDRLAREGVRFEQFYVNSPICSPSRTAISTGQYPQRWRITSYLNNRKDNQRRGMAQWLDPQAPMLARSLQQAGYATGHFGKWHMGGQRDVNDAPPITAYGFDASLTNFEGMGPKLLPLTLKPGPTEPGKIWQRAEILGDGYRWMLRSEITTGFVDAALPFIDKAVASGKPFYINLWPDDVHSPFWPPVESWGDGSKRRLYLSVLEAMDQQLGRLFERIRDDKHLRDNTIVLVCSDNGPELGAGEAGPFRGYKTQLYEGGVRSPLIVWGPGLVKKQNHVDTGSVWSAIDLAPSLLTLTHTPWPENVSFDGEPLVDTLLGQGGSRAGEIFFRRPPDRNAFYGDDDLPDLAVRSGQWKLLCEYDGSEVELYDLSVDVAEANNVAEKHPQVTGQLVKALLAWHQSMPPDNGPSLE